MVARNGGGVVEEVLGLMLVLDLRRRDKHGSFANVRDGAVNTHTTV